MTSDICAIIPAAGLSRRMKMNYPKQYIMINNKTIIEYSIETILAHPRIAKVIVVINSKDKYFCTLPLANNPKITVVKGGNNRSDSVLAGIKASRNLPWILVHDAVRPCLHYTDLVNLLSVSKISKIGGVLVTPVRDTLKYANNKNIILHTMKRTGLWHALTPQFFSYDILYSCLKRAIKEGATITDESSALEYCGLYPKLVEGRSDNIKVTFLRDLQVVQFLLMNHNVN